LQPLLSTNFARDKHTRQGASAHDRSSLLFDVAVITWRVVFC
jgi:hypothetical protein